MQKREFKGNYTFSNVKEYPIVGQIYDTEAMECILDTPKIFVYNTNGNCICCMNYKKEDWKER